MKLLFIVLFTIMAMFVIIPSYANEPTNKELLLQYHDLTHEYVIITQNMEILGGNAGPKWQEKADTVWLDIIKMENTLTSRGVPNDIISYYDMTFSDNVSFEPYAVFPEFNPDVQNKQDTFNTVEKIATTLDPPIVPRHTQAELNQIASEVVRMDTGSLLLHGEELLGQREIILESIDFMGTDAGQAFFQRLRDIETEMTFINVTLESRGWPEFSQFVKKPAFAVKLEDQIGHQRFIYTMQDEKGHDITGVTDFFLKQQHPELFIEEPQVPDFGFEIQKIGNIDTITTTTPDTQSEIDYNAEWKQADLEDSFDLAMDKQKALIEEYQKNVQDVLRLQEEVNQLQQEVIDFMRNEGFDVPVDKINNIPREMKDCPDCVKDEIRQQLIDLILENKGDINNLPDGEIKQDKQQNEEKKDDGADNTDFLKEQIEIAQEVLGENCNGCTPIMFKLDPYQKISYDVMYPETAVKEKPVENSKDTVWWYLKCGDDFELKRMSFKYTSGFLLFVEYHPDGKLTDCNEMMMSDHLQAFQRFQEQAIDSNYDGKLNIHDKYMWPKLRVMDMQTWQVYTPEELGIKEFQFRNGILMGGDYVHSISKYAGGCSDYIQDEPFVEYTLEMGGLEWCKGVSMDHGVRITWYHPEGIIKEDGTRLPSYDVIGGYYPLAH